MKTLAEQLFYLRNTPTGAGYKLPQDDLFAKANANLLPKYKKLGIIHSALEREEKLISKINASPIICNVLGCNKEFNNTSSYNTHYNSIHRYLCKECRRSLPTAHLLDLHLSEQHDSYFAVLAERDQAQYVCLLEECPRIMKSPEERHKHCIEDHNLPPDFRYGLLNRKQKKEQGNTTAVENEDNGVTFPEAMELDGKIVKKTRAFSFGMPKEKMFTKESSKAINLKELECALPKH